MKVIVLISVIAFVLIVFILSIFFRRSYKIDYDGKTLFFSFLFLVITVIVWKWGSVSPDPLGDQSYTAKFLWAAVIISGCNAIIQFLFWTVYSIIRLNNWIRMPRFIFNILGLMIFVGISIYTIHRIFHVDLGGLLVTSTVLSAIIGLSLQDTLTNLFAGLSLQIETPFNIDEWVNLGGYEGKVVSQNWRSLTLITREQHSISLPNKAVAEEKIINYSRPAIRQIHSFFVVLDYSHPPNEVKIIISELLNEIKEVAIDNIAFPFVVSYEASGIKYCIKYWIDDYGDVVNIQDIVLSRLWYKLKRHKIKIPYSISEIHMDLITEENNQKKVDKINLYKKNLLKKQKWLSDMEDNQFEVLAESAIILSYAADDNLITQGESGDSMFIITKGSAKVLIIGSNNSEVYVADKNAGDFFGEMSLLTGGVRTATVRAIGDMEVIIIDKKAFSEILLKDSNILELLVGALESNQSSLTKIIEEEKQNSNIPIKSAREIVMNKILRYLELK